MVRADGAGHDQGAGGIAPRRAARGGADREHPVPGQYQIRVGDVRRVQGRHDRAAAQGEHVLAGGHYRLLASRGAAVRAAAESFIGSTVRHVPSNECSAPATAAAVGTRPISPTPLAP